MKKRNNKKGNIENPKFNYFTFQKIIGFALIILSCLPISYLITRLLNSKVNVSDLTFGIIIIVSLLILGIKLIRAKHPIWFWPV